MASSDISAKEKPIPISSKSPSMKDSLNLGHSVYVSSDSMWNYDVHVLRGTAYDAHLKAILPIRMPS